MIVMYKKIGVVGDKDSVLAFKALGVDVAPVVGADEARRAVDKMAMNDYAVIFVTEQVAVTIEETIELAEKTTCSRDSIREIQNACSTGINVSTVDLDTIDKLIDIEQDICNEIPHTNFISDLLIRRGGHTKFPSEKNDVNEEDDANGT